MRGKFARVTAELSRAPQASSRCGWCGRRRAGGGSALDDEVFAGEVVEDDVAVEDELGLAGLFELRLGIAEVLAHGVHGGEGALGVVVAFPQKMDKLAAQVEVAGGGRVLGGGPRRLRRRGGGVRLLCWRCGVCGCEGKGCEGGAVLAGLYGHLVCA